ncbi:Dystroglycan, partial [Struthio camelus australis]
RCGKEAPVTSAEIVLYTAMEALQVQERLNIVHTMAEYLHLDSSFITLLQYKNLVHGGLQNQTILAKDTRRIKSTVNQYVGLSWPVKCGGFVVLHELIQVLRHNVESHHLSQLLGYEIVGWRILQRGGYEKKSPRRQRRQLMITPTPTLEPIRTTQRPTGGDAHSPVASDVLSSLLTRLVVSPVQSLASLHEESITIASYKMQNNIHLRSQENLATLEIDSSWDWMTNSPVSSIFGDSPDLSPSLIIKTPFPSTELEGLPTRASGMSLLLEQPAPHMPETNSYFLPGKSE